MMQIFLDPLIASSQNIINTENAIFLYSSIGGLAMTLLGTLILYLSYRKISYENPLAKLVFYTAVFDSVFALCLFLFYNFSFPMVVLVGIENLIYISAHGSLICTCLVSSIYHFTTRTHQRIFMSRYKLWLLELVILFGIYNTIFYILQDVLNNFNIFFYSFWAITLAMEIYVGFSNARMVYLVKVSGMELEDKTPAYMSLFTLVLWIALLVGNFCGFVLADDQFWLTTLCNFGALSLGFFNFIIGIRRINKIAKGTFDETKVKCQNNGSSIGFDVSLILNLRDDLENDLL